MVLRRSWTRVCVLAVLALGLVVAACGGDDSGGGGGSGSNEKVTLSFLIDNQAPTVAMAAQALVEAFARRRTRTSRSSRDAPGRGEGDNIVKTRLATGEMTDIFRYNPARCSRRSTRDRTSSI